MKNGRFHENISLHVAARILSQAAGPPELSPGRSEQFLKTVRCQVKEAVQPCIPKPLPAPAFLIHDLTHTGASRQVLLLTSFSTPGAEAPAPGALPATQTHRERTLTVFADRERKEPRAASQSLEPSETTIPRSWGCSASVNTHDPPGPDRQTDMALAPLLDTCSLISHYVLSELSINQKTQVCMLRKTSRIPNCTYHISNVFGEIKRCLHACECVCTCVCAWLCLCRHLLVPPSDGTTGRILRCPLLL